MQFCVKNTIQTLKNSWNLTTVSCTLCTGGKYITCKKNNMLVKSLWVFFPSATNSWLNKGYYSALQNFPLDRIRLEATSFWEIDKFYASRFHKRQALFHYLTMHRFCKVLFEEADFRCRKWFMLRIMCAVNYFAAPRCRKKKIIQSRTAN